MINDSAADAVSGTSHLVRPSVEVPFCAVSFRGRSVPTMSVPGFFKIAFIRAGSMAVRGPFGELDAQAGDVILIGPRVMGTSVDSAGHVTTVLYLHREFMVDMRYWQHRDRMTSRETAHTAFELHDAHRADVLTVGVVMMEQISGNLDSLVTATNAGTNCENFAYTHGLLSLTMSVIPDDGGKHFGSLHASEGHPVQSLRAEAVTAANLLRSQFAHRWTLSELARAVNLSRAQLARVFVAAIGRTPQMYLTQVRVQHMALLLRETTLPVKAICTQVGWKDSSHAAAVFARHMQVTPERYRARGDGMAFDS